jgi:hypothetical protein
MARVATVDLGQLEELFSEICRISGRTLDNSARGQLHADEVFLAKLDDYRAAVGALWLQLHWQIEQDIGDMQAIAGSLWKCMWCALARSGLRPHKYHGICSANQDDFGTATTRLANLVDAALQEPLAARWGIGSWQQHVHAVFQTSHDLMQQHVVYRDLAIAILQIGIGWGGMLVGLVALILSVVLTALAG